MRSKMPISLVAWEFAVSAWFLSSIALLSLLVLPAGCGFSETASTTAVIAEAKKQELEQANKTQQQMMQNLEDTNRQIEERLKAAEGR